VTTIEQTLFLCARILRNLSRQPIWIVVMVVQPIFWLLLYSQLFRRITDLGSFGTSDYVDYLTPGVAVMTAFFSGSWAGMGMIEDIDRGVIERVLATPARRSSIVFGWVLYSGIVATLQALLILVTGLVLGATNGGVPGWLVILLAAFLVAAGFAGLSHGLALLTRQEASMIAIAQFIGLPPPVPLVAPHREGADARVDADTLAAEPGRVGDPPSARRSAPGHELGRARCLSRPPRLVRRRDRRLRDVVLQRLPARSVTARTDVSRAPAPARPRAAARMPAA
jgi:ABC-2 type transport system permease protein